MNLDEAQRKKVADWIAQGMKLSDIQTRIGSELGVSMTYMDVRLLVDDLKLTPKDVERPKIAASTLTSAATSPPPTPSGKGAPPPTKEAKPAGPASGGSVSVSVDELAIPGTVVSGKVTFTDGNTAAWHLDQTGRLGLAPKDAGYRPPAADLQQFQMALESELAKMGF